MRRRLFSALIVLSLASAPVLAVDGSADAAVVTMTSGGVTYRADDSTRAAGATVVTVDATAPKALVLPTTVSIQGTTYDVTAVAGGAAQALDLTSLSLPGRLVTIGDSAFLSNRLTSLTVPDSVSTIGDGAFVDNQIASLSLSTALQQVGEGAFAGNRLTTLTLPASLRVIDSGAFVSNRIGSVVIPAAVTEIGDAAFADNPLSAVGFTGPPPTTFTPATPAAGSPIGSLGRGDGLTVFYFASFDASRYAGGFTTPVWQGYAARPVGASSPGTPGLPPGTVVGQGPPRPVITRVKHRRKADGLVVFRISVTNVGGLTAQGVRVLIKNRPHAVTYPGGKSAGVGTLAPGATRTVKLRAVIRSRVRTKFVFKALATNAPRDTARIRLAPRRDR